ncbi:MAG TPA: hypothetical protein VGO93_12265, partial [Candidatus Xenobia bacterium]
MRRYAAGMVGLGFLLSGCGGNGGGTFNPGVQPTLPVTAVLTDFMFTANAGSTTLSEFAVTNTATGALSGGNNLDVTDGGTPASPVGELLDTGFTGSPGSGVDQRVGNLYVAVPDGLLSYSYAAVSGSLQAAQTTAVAPAGGGSLTGPLAEDTSLGLLYAATTNGIDVYVVSGTSVSRPGVSNAVALANASSLTIATVNGAEVLLATSPAGLTVYPINTSHLGTGGVLGTPVTQGTLAVPSMASASSTVGGSSAGSILVAVAEAPSGGGTNGETFNLTAPAGTPGLGDEHTFTVGT